MVLVTVEGMCQVIYAGLLTGDLLAEYMCTNMITSITMIRRPGSLVISLVTIITLDKISGVRHIPIIPWTKTGRAQACGCGIDQSSFWVRVVTRKKYEPRYYYCYNARSDFTVRSRRICAL